MSKIKELINSFRQIPKLFALVWRVDHRYLIYMVCEMLCFAAIPYPTLFLVKYSLDILENYTSGNNVQAAENMTLFTHFAAVCVALIILQLLVSLLKSLFNSIRPARSSLVIGKLYNDFHKKSMELDYELLAEKDIQELQTLAGSFIQYKLRNTVWNFISLFSSLIVFVASCVMIAGVDFAVILIVIAGTLLNSLIITGFASASANINDEISKNSRYISYFEGVVTKEEYAKDVCIFEMGEPIIERLNGYYKTALRLEKRRKLLDNIRGFLNTGCYNAIEFFVYAMLGYAALGGNMSIGTFSLLLGNIALFRDYLGRILSVLAGYSETAKYVEHYTSFISLESRFRKTGTMPVTLNKNDSFDIEFRNVSFKYPGQDEYVLENFNLLVHSGEKLSVVGANGAGKSTFVKLLMRLYDPTEGQILINNVDIKNYDYDQYLSIFAPIFQDYRLFAFTVGENISSFKSDPSADAIAAAAKKAGIDGRISELPDGYDTYISKLFDDTGVAFSGGEQQKIAIARAYFKQDSLVTILDEPTSALDPKAEHDLYREFNDFIGKSTAFFISHRLSSSKFCDRIVVIKDKRVHELGTHEELMANKGYYSELFSMQASYYM